MTEAEWQSADDPGSMLDGLPGPVSDRKLRLFALACLARVPEPFVPTGVWELYDAFVDYLDGRTTPDEWLDTFSAAKADQLRITFFTIFRPDPMTVARVTSESSVAEVAYRLAWSPGPSGDSPRWESNEQRFAAQEQRRSVERDAQCYLMRDIFGNPFRPVAVDPRWRTVDAIGLARAIYEDRAFDRMPLLADALMDAGCADEQVVGHCRGGGPHVRGCWVVDLVLGRE
jgi:hypothetical protein